MWRKGSLGRMLLPRSCSSLSFEVIPPRKSLLLSALAPPSFPVLNDKWLCTWPLNSILGVAFHLHWGEWDPIVLQLTLPHAVVWQCMQQREWLFSGCDYLTPQRKFLSLCTWPYHALFSVSVFPVTFDSYYEDGSDQSPSLSPWVRCGCIHRWWTTLQCLVPVHQGTVTIWRCFEELTFYVIDRKI